MSLYKRRSTWWIDFTTPSGERIRRSADTSNKVDAQELHDRLKAEYWRLKKLGEQPTRTWDEATSKWLGRPHISALITRTCLSWTGCSSSCGIECWLRSRVTR
jgi:hypothetical protein